MHIAIRTLGGGGGASKFDAKFVADFTVLPNGKKILPPVDKRFCYKSNLRI
jgi:hypothetical protein